MADWRPEGDDEWSVGWDAHRRLQMTYALAATPAQRLAWLEQAIERAYQTGALPRVPQEPS